MTTLPLKSLRNDIDPEGLLEFSVVYTDRSLNHMSKKFQQVMNDLSIELKSVYNAHAVALIPGGGTYAMEAVARQLVNDNKTLIIRNGWFSYRWTQIIEKGKLTDQSQVLCAGNTEGAFSPVPIDEAIATIKETEPNVVFAPHVETASGMILPDDYIKQLSEAVHSVGGLLVIDCIASGCVWLDMQELGIDVLISAPQKGWSSTPCAGVVMLSELAVQAVDNSESSSFSCDLKQWLNIMRAYDNAGGNGGHAYHATMPTDGLKQFRDSLFEAKEIGYQALKDKQWELGNQVRQLLAEYGIQSVAAEGYQAPGVVVSYTDRDDVNKGKAFAEKGVQIAGGVPLKCGEPDNFKTFRLGLFGLDKLTDITGSVNRLRQVFDEVEL